MSRKPLVTILIATRDRHEDLEQTLRDLLRQDYPSLEMIVIDDASTPPIESLVKKLWPTAQVVRHERSLGQSARRNEGFRLAHGVYILHLDDDCAPVRADGISLSVKYMESEQRCAGIAYRIWNGHEMPDAVLLSTLAPGNCLSYVGAGAFLRTAALDETSGYRDFFFGYVEEKELSLQLLKRGWSLSFRPDLLAHHRCSPRNRSNSAVWKRSLRNNLWTILIHCPMTRLPVEVLWKITVGAWDAFRLKRGRLFLEALVETVRGVVEVWKLRDPLDPLSLRRFDALRAYGVLPYEMFEAPPSQRCANFARWAKRWPSRLREASFFSSSRRLVGRGQLHMHEDELGK